MPRVVNVKAGAGLRWPQLLPVAVIPAVLTPLILWRLPTDFLPILLGDYLALHFALYGLLAGTLLWLIRRQETHLPAIMSLSALVLAAGAVTAHSIAALGWPIDSYLTSFRPIPGRLSLILAVLAGTLPYFMADEWATRGAGAAPGGYVPTKLCLLLSRILAATLNLSHLFFLIIIVPMILVFLIVYGLFSTWAYRRTWHLFVGAVGNAIAFAWAIAGTFPVVG